MQTPSAAVSRGGAAATQSVAKSDSPPSGRTMTRSASRTASYGCSSLLFMYGQTLTMSKLLLLLLLTISHLTQNIPTVSGHQVLKLVFLVEELRGTVLIRNLEQINNSYFVIQPVEQHPYMALCSMRRRRNSSAFRCTAPSVFNWIPRESQNVRSSCHCCAVWFGGRGKSF